MAPGEFLEDALDGEDLFDFDDVIANAGDTMAELNAAIDSVLIMESETREATVAPALPSASTSGASSPGALLAGAGVETTPAATPAATHGVAKAAPTPAPAPLPTKSSPSAPATPGAASSKVATPSNPQGVQPLGEAPPSFKPAATPPPLAAPAPATAAAKRAPEAAPGLGEAIDAPRGLAARSLSLRSVAIAAAAVLALNVGLIGFVVHSLRSVQGMVREVGDKVSSAPVPTTPARNAAEAVVEATPPPRPVEDRPTGEQALARARRALDAGEFEGARQILYGLLSVVDRIAPEERRDIEAQARFLVADTWRREADASEALLAVARGEAQRRASSEVDAPAPGESR